MNGLLRRTSLLSNHKWKETPFLETGKTPKDKLVDILVEIGRLFADVDSVRWLTKPHEISERLKSILDRLCAVNDELNSRSVGSGRDILKFMDF